ncbi:hypothetical protein [Solimonas marina]|uniref:Uncharacterized protein n=1 Tax=Solimonas marina TaxID=2714601 RepID=A0A969W8R5_9GAMM|nr:hypothetical protein [Solimonas marina]NKF21604.1 hypothetical protein [Solimonas marina]
MPSTENRQTRNNTPENPTFPAQSRAARHIVGVGHRQDRPMIQYRISVALLRITDALNQRSALPRRLRRPLRRFRARLIAAVNDLDPANRRPVA